MCCVGSVEIQIEIKNGTANIKSEFFERLEGRPSVRKKHDKIETLDHAMIKMKGNHI